MTGSNRLFARASVCIVTGWLLLSVAFGASQIPSPMPSAASGSGLGFIQNKGQWDSRAKFLLPSNGLNVWLTADGPVMDVHRFVPEPGNTQRTPKGHMEGDILRTTFVGAAPVSVEPTNRLAGNLNYLIGQNQSKWVTQVPHFAEATSGELYPGIRARYYVDGGVPRYDLVVAPGADPSQIALKVDGAQGVQVLANGNLQIQTSLGPIEERGLVAYQTAGANHTQVACKMTSQGNVVRFKLGSYDKSRKMVIDPLVYSTFLNVSGNEQYYYWEGSGVDASGQVTMAGLGLANNTSFPTTLGAYQRTPAGLNNGIYIAKLSADGAHLVYGTFLSGTKRDANELYGGPVDGLAVDQSGNVIVAGHTTDTDFPVTAFAYKKTYPGLGSGYVSRISSDGSTLLSSTYYDGFIYALALDHEGNAVLYGGAGVGSSMRLSPNAFQSWISGNDPGAAFVAKIDPLGQFVAATFLSGCGVSTSPTLDNEMAYQPISFDADDNVVIASATSYYSYATFIPITPNALLSAEPAPQNNSFVVKLSSDLSTLMVGTIFPFTITATEVQSDGSFLIAGWSYSSTFRTSPGTYATGQTTGGICLARLSADGSTMLRTVEIQCGDAYANVGNLARANAMATGADGNILIGGISVAGFPTTVDAYQPAAGGHDGAIFLELSHDFSKLLYSTYLSGTSYSYVHAVYPIGLGSAIIEGPSGNGTFPTTPGAYDNISAGTGGTNFVAKFDLPVSSSVSLSANPVTGGFSAVGTVSLPAVAPAGGVVVHLSSSNPNAPVPSSVTVASGQIKANFTVATTSVAKVSTGTITATIDGGTGTVGISVLPAVLTSISSATTEIAAGTAATVTVKLNGQAAGSGDLIGLLSSSPVVTVPATVPIYHGSTLAAFTATASAVTISTPVTITASFAGVKKTFVLTLDPGLSNFSVSPTSIVGGVAALGTATIAGKAGPAGVTLNLASSNAALAVPTTVTIPANGNYKTFALTSQGVNSATVVTVTGKEGTLTKTFTITVNPASLLSLTPTVSSVVGGQALNLVVKLNGNAGSSGLAVTLSSNKTALVVPGGVAISPNTSSKVFTITTKAVSVATQVTISAKLGTQTQSTVVTVNPKS
jgi:hypothetical protein